jgi:hypothetical protein
MKAGDEAVTLTINLPDEKNALLAAKARAQGVTAEEYAQQVLEHDLDTGTSQPRRPMSEFMREIWGDLPDDARAKLPRDGASQVDHNVYGLPKREQ